MDDNLDYKNYNPEDIESEDNIEAIQEEVIRSEPIQDETAEADWDEFVKDNDNQVFDSQDAVGEDLPAEQEKAASAAMRFEEYFGFIDRSIKKNSRYSIDDEFRIKDKRRDSVAGDSNEALDNFEKEPPVKSDFTGDSNDFVDIDDFNDDYYTAENDYRIKRDQPKIELGQNLEPFDADADADEFDARLKSDETGDERTADSLTDFYGVKAWTYDPALASVANPYPISSIYIAKIFIDKPVRVTSMLASVNFPAGYIDAYAGIYDADGKLIAKTENMGSRLGGKGVQAIDFVESVALRQQRMVYLALLINGISSPHLSASPPSAAMQVKTILPLRAGVIVGQYSVLPESIPLENASYSTPYFWLALR